jgi:hypothetical protein
MITQRTKREFFLVSTAKSLRKAHDRDPKRLRRVIIERVASSLLRKPIDERRILPERSALAFWLTEVPHLPDDSFLQIFRLSREAFGFVYTELSLNPKLTASKGFGLDMKVAATIFWLGNSGSLAQTARVFGIGTSTLQSWYTLVCEAIVSNLGQWICWPAPGSVDFALLQLDFRKLSTLQHPFHHVIGAIDSSHIPLSSKPACDEANSYWNRKYKPSVHLQAVVDARGRFMHVEVGQPGATHDSTVLRNSELFLTIQNRVDNISYLLGDKGYPLLNWLMTPYRDRRVRNEAECRFNDVHSRMRVIVEHTFGILKTRFRRLFCVPVDLFHVPRVVIACCILHNICIFFKVPRFTPKSSVDPANNDHLPLLVDQFAPDAWSNAEAGIKRDALKESIPPHGPL